MSFSFSQNLLADISENSSQSQPPAQPQFVVPMEKQEMQAYHRHQLTRSNFPRPSSCPDFTRKQTSSNLSSSQSKMMPQQQNLGQILKDVNSSITSVPSSCSRMFEEGLSFLESLVHQKREILVTGVKKLESTIKANENYADGKREEYVKLEKIVDDCVARLGSLNSMLSNLETEQEELAKLATDLSTMIENQNEVVHKMLSNVNRGKAFAIKNDTSPLRGEQHFTHHYEQSRNEVSTVFRSRLRTFNVSPQGRDLEAGVDFNSIMEFEDSDMENEWEE